MDPWGRGWLQTMPGLLRKIALPKPWSCSWLLVAGEATPCRESCQEYRRNSAVVVVVDVAFHQNSAAAIVATGLSAIVPGVAARLLLLLLLLLACRGWGRGGRVLIHWGWCLGISKGRRWWLLGRFRLFAWWRRRRNCRAIGCG